MSEKYVKAITIADIDNFYQPITEYTIQKNGQGKYRLLLPSFFGLFRKTAKGYFASYAGGYHSEISWNSKEDVCRSITAHNNLLDRVKKSNTWTDDGKCC